MRGEYYPPEFKKEGFHCAHCQVFAHQDWYDTYVSKPAGLSMVGISASQCFHCREWTYWFGQRMIVPEVAPVEPPHPDLPETCKKDYEEARSVFTRSPRSAAALLRLCIQELMPHLGQKGKSIDDDIKALVAEGLPLLIQKALDYCRVVGNHAVHPGEIRIEDTPEIAQNLFRMVNLTVEDRITRPREVEEAYKQLPEKDRGRIEKRDGRPNTS